MVITALNIKSIAEELESGWVCYYHILSGELESYPDPNDPYFEE